VLTKLYPKNSSSIPIPDSQTLIAINPYI